MKLLLYCTKGKVGLYDNRKKITGALENFFLDKFGYDKPPLLNGKIVGECDFEVEEIELTEYDDYNYSIYSGMYFETKTLQEEELCEQSCLTADELDEYLDLYKEKEIYGYAIHIKNLHIFDEPKELSEYYKKYGNIYNVYYMSLTDAPQNMMIVYDGFGNKYVLVSFHPEGLCDILNGKKLVDVRKVVLKEML